MDSVRDGQADHEATRLADGRILSTTDLAPVVYEDLRRLADSLFRREPEGVTLQPTALVHEAYLVLADQRNQSWESRANFLAVAATAMRRVLTNAAKARGRDKRGGGLARVTLVEDAVRDSGGEVDLLDLDAALAKLAKVRERYVRILELRFFAGLSLDEVARELGVSRTIVVRDWAKAKAWLMTELEDLRGAD
ncbi:MAG: ECF-type sigma factor [Planctomycetota bacterium]